MTEKQFLAELKKVAGQYEWHIVKGMGFNKIVGWAKGRKQIAEHSPLTAVVNAKIRKTRHRPLFTPYTPQVHTALNMDLPVSLRIEGATLGQGNRGYTQVLRGKIRQAVGLK